MARKMTRGRVDTKKSSPARPAKKRPAACRRHPKPPKLVIDSSLILPEDRARLQKGAFSSVAEYLTAQLGEADIARELALDVLFIALDWRPEVIPMAEIRGIICCSFGYHRDPETGNLTPGDMNEALARYVVRLHQDTTKHIDGGAPVYAQWEIAQLLRPHIPDVRSIAPTVDSVTSLTKYLSTYGVIQAAKDMGAPIGDKVSIAVVAWHDHVMRCVQIAEELGFNAGVVAVPHPGRHSDDAANENACRAMNPKNLSGQFHLPFG